jgi:hypothetical protein
MLEEVMEIFSRHGQFAQAIDGSQR